MKGSPRMSGSRVIFCLCPFVLRVSRACNRMLARQTRALFDVVLPQAYESHMLDLKDSWRTHGLCRTLRFHRDRARAQHVRWCENISSQNLPHLTWTETCDSSLNWFPISNRFDAFSMALYRADWLMRSFLRYVLGGTRQVVLAGSVGTAILQNKLGIRRDWRPTDIDFFVTGVHSVSRIIDAYVEGVLKPLGCKRWEQRTQLFYYEDRGGTEHGIPAGTTEAHEELRGLIRRSSSVGHAPSYEVLQTVLLEFGLPEGSSTTLCNLIRPLNIVHVRVPGSGTPDLASRVRSGFDLVPCAISVEIDDDFSFRCTCDVRTLAAARLSLVFFNVDHVRRRNRDDIPRLLDRVQKYQRRGFMFALSSNAILSTLSPNDSAARGSVVTL